LGTTSFQRTVTFIDYKKAFDSININVMSAGLYPNAIPEVLPKPKVLLWQSRESKVVRLDGTAEQAGCWKYVDLHMALNCLYDFLSNWVTAVDSIAPTGWHTLYGFLEARTATCVAFGFATSRNKLETCIWDSWKPGPNY
jgi:hypothetical protein